jgi:hypothetical protein
MLIVKTFLKNEWLINFCLLSSTTCAISANMTTPGQEMGTSRPAAACADQAILLSNDS